MVSYGLIFLCICEKFEDIRVHCIHITCKNI